MRQIVALLSGGVFLGCAVLKNGIPRACRLSRYPNHALPGLRLPKASRCPFSTVRPEFTPKGSLGHASGQVEHFGNFLPSKSFAIRARHDSTLVKKTAIGFLKDSG